MSVRAVEAPCLPRAAPAIWSGAEQSREAWPFLGLARHEQILSRWRPILPFLRPASPTARRPPGGGRRARGAQAKEKEMLSRLGVSVGSAVVRMTMYCR